jgi:hypothetical protein
MLSPWSVKVALNNVNPHPSMRHVYRLVAYTRHKIPRIGNVNIGYRRSIDNKSWLGMGNGIFITLLAIPHGVCIQLYSTMQSIQPYRWPVCIRGQRCICNPHINGVRYEGVKWKLQEFEAFETGKRIIDVLLHCYNNKASVAISNLIS